MARRLLITGGAGFVGSHIAEAASAAGWEIAVLDNLSTGKRANVPPNATFYELDLADAEAVDRALGDFRPAVISHQAAQASVAVSVREPIVDLRTNIAGTLHLLEAARRHGVERVVYAGTGGAVYGEVPEGRRATTATLPVPQSPYACSKYAAECYLSAYQACHGLDYQVLRYANVYGPRQDPHGEAGVVAIFCQRLVAGEPLRLNARRHLGDDGCVRDYVFVSDVVRANLAALNGALSGRVVNVGTGVGSSTRDIIHALASLAGGEPLVESGPPRAGDIERSVLDPGELADRLGGLVSLPEGLRLTWAWFNGAGRAA